ncbi:DUF2887 domain-containing protein [Calothrix sp. 336/3]|nr:DUF2887 domain-containing protein [Calothrix sp. 336/3]
MLDDFDSVEIKQTALRIDGVFLPGVSKTLFTRGIP